MSIEDIKIEEEKQFAKDAKKDDWDVKFENGILYLSNHNLHSDISVSWEKGNESWSVSKEGRNNVVPVGELSYPSSVFF